MASLLVVMATGAEARAEDSPSIDLGARAGFIAVPAFFVPLGTLVGAEAHYRLSPTVRLGAYGQRFSAESTSSDHKDYYAEYFSAWRAGARVEFHARPEATLDPWAGAGLGIFSADDRRKISGTQRIGGVGPDVSIETGVDVRIGEHFAIGGLLSLVVPLANTTAVGGTWYSGFGVVPAPFLRATVSF